MKKLLILFLTLFSVSVFAQQIEIEVVPDVEQEMQETEFKHNEMQFNEYFSNIGKGGYFGYLLNTDFDDILKDACKWKGCKKPLFTSRQNELVSEFKEYLSKNYNEWIKNQGGKNIGGGN